MSTPSEKVVTKLSEQVWHALHEQFASNTDQGAARIMAAHETIGKAIELAVQTLTVMADSNEQKPVTLRLDPDQLDLILSAFLKHPAAESFGD